jgi:hypothetical protein
MTNVALRQAAPKKEEERGKEEHENRHLQAEEGKDCGDCARGERGDMLRGREAQQKGPCRVSVYRG